MTAVVNGYSVKVLWDPMPDVTGYKEESKESEDITLAPDLWRSSIRYGVWCKLMWGKNLQNVTFYEFFLCPKTKTLKLLFAITLLNRNQSVKCYSAVFTPPRPAAGCGGVASAFGVG